MTRINYVNGIDWGGHGRPTIDTSVMVDTDMVILTIASCVGSSIKSTLAGISRLRLSAKGDQLVDDYLDMTRETIETAGLPTSVSIPEPIHAMTLLPSFFALIAEHEAGICAIAVQTASGDLGLPVIEVIQTETKADADKAAFRRPNSALLDLGRQFGRTAKEKGFREHGEWIARKLLRGTPHGPWAQVQRDYWIKRLGLVISEVVEAQEEIRSGYEIDYIYHTGDGKPEGVAIEMADALIRLLELADEMGIDIGEAIAVKHEYNQTRERLHGRKF